MIEIAIIGLGYIGLPLAVEFGKKFKVIGFDTDKKRINELNSNFDKTSEVSKKEIIESKRTQFTYNVSTVKSCNYKIIAVPTPIYKNKKPDLRILKKAIHGIKKYINKGDIIILESTVYPGVTEDFCAPLIEKLTSLKFNSDFFMGYCPERINPGDKKNNLTNINKLVSGSSIQTTNLINKLYKNIIKAKVISTSSIKVAESAKVIENAQRDINIAFMNEISMIFNKLNIDTSEVLKAASSKWNFLNFSPGLVGGHCISVDPYYLSYIAKKNSILPKIIDKGREVNESVPNFIISNLKRLITKKIKKKNIKILLMGITFKENCPDIRNSKSIDIYRKLESKKYNVTVFDPFYMEKKQQITKINFTVNPKKKYYDVIMINVNHDYFYSLGLEKIKEFGKKKSLLFDLRSMFEKDKSDFRL